MTRRSRAKSLCQAMAIGLVLACGAPENLAESTPERIIAVAPAVVESLFALGLGDKVVGVGSYAHWPPEVEELPRIGGLYDPRFETIAALEADLAILLPSEGDLERALENLGVEVLTVPHESLADIGRAFLEISARVGVEGRGQELVDELERSLQPRSAPLEARVLLSVARQPARASEIYAAGPATFLGELLARLGAANVTEGDGELYPRIGFEEAVLRQPDVVIELQPEPVSEAEGDAWRNDWAEVAGNDAPCVVVVDGSHVLLPGPRVGELYRDLETALAGCLS